MQCTLTLCRLVPAAADQLLGVHSAPPALSAARKCTLTTVEEAALAHRVGLPRFLLQRYYKDYAYFVHGLYVNCAQTLGARRTLVQKLLRQQFNCTCETWIPMNAVQKEDLYNNAITALRTHLKLRDESIQALDNAIDNAIDAAATATLQADLQSLLDPELSSEEELCDITSSSSSSSERIEISSTSPPRRRAASSGGGGGAAGKRAPAAAAALAADSAPIPCKCSCVIVLVLLCTQIVSVLVLLFLYCCVHKL